MDRDQFYDDGLLIPIAQRAGRLVHIAEIHEDDRTGFTCPKCRKRLVPRLGTERRHHFAHFESSTCQGALESALHQYAKMLFGRHEEFVAPAQLIQWGHHSTIVATAGYVRYSAVRAEEPIGGVRPDLTLLRPAGLDPVLVEIVVTHRCDATKRRLLDNLKLPCLEIDVSRCVTPAGFDREALETLLIRSPDDKRKKWLYIPGRDEIIAKWQEEETGREEAEEEARRRKLAERSQEERDRQGRVAEALAKEVGVELFGPNYDLAETLCSTLGVSLQNLPEYLNTPCRGEAIFLWHRFLWQGQLFRAFIHPGPRPSNSHLDIARLESWVLRCLPNLLIPELRKGNPSQHECAELLDSYMRALEGFGFVEYAGVSDRPENRTYRLLRGQAAVQSHRGK